MVGTSRPSIAPARSMRRPLLLVTLVLALVGCGGGSGGGNGGGQSTPPIVEPPPDDQTPPDDQDDEPAPNQAPIANAGGDRTVLVGDAVTVSGDASTDADGNALTYHWALISSPDPSAVLSGAETIDAGFTAHLAGTYVLELIVNDGEIDSAPDRAEISTSNSPPVANAGPDQTVAVGGLALLDGSASSDVDSNPLGFAWSLLERPEGSAAALDNPLVETPSFVVDQAGTYEIELVVDDAEKESAPDRVVVSTENSRPVANAGANASAVVGATVAVVGSASSDFDGDLLTYSWALIHAPQGSTATLADPTAASTSFVPDLAGIYVVQLVVDDGALESTPDTARVDVALTPPGGGDPDPGDPEDPEDPEPEPEDPPAKPIPPDPATIAPPVPDTTATVLAASTDFLYTGASPIQTGVAAGTIEPIRAAVIRGLVTTRDGAPLPGVTIAIKDRPELGVTVSRADGMFDLAVNGGGTLTIDYSLDGHLPAQRTIVVPWQDFAYAPDVALVALDETVTRVDLSALTEIAVAAGSIEEDEDGRRQARVFFEPGTSAEMVLPDGTRLALDTLDVRATEYTVGPNGPKSMPGGLPANVGYTYAVELSADEAIAAGATRVEFDKPVAFYVENFLDFPVGGAVPMGYYDREKAAWVPSENGRVIEVLGSSGGLAEIDIDGDGTADTAEALAALGIDAAERAKLGEIYAAGTTLWRVEIDHFTPWDCNWPYGPPDDAVPPLLSLPPDDENLQCVDETGGSIIECQRQVLGERIGITGTPYTLNYRSSRTEGRLSARSFDIAVSGASVPSSLERIELEILVAGRSIRYAFAPMTNLTQRFVWDGLDAYGRPVQGRAPATIRLSYVYGAVYLTPAEFARSFARISPSGAEIGRNRDALETILSQTEAVSLGNWDASRLGLGGWTLDVHHAYDPIGRVLHRGDGGTQVGRTPRLETLNDELRYPHALAMAPDGTLYVADTNNHRIRRVTPDGEDDTVAGTGARGYSGDGGPATSATLYTPSGIAVAPDGGLYIVDLNNHRIRYVSPDGIISTVAGQSGAGFSGDGGPATDAMLNGPRGIALAPDGSIYFSDGGNHRIRQITPDGIIHTIAGTGTSGFSGDGGPATEAQLRFPMGVALGPDGSVYFSDNNNHRVRRIAPDGTITTFAGGGSFDGADNGDGGPATEAEVDDPNGVAVGPDGSVYIAEIDSDGIFGGRIRRVWPDGIITTIAGMDGMHLGETHGVAVGVDGEIYIANSGGNDIYRLSLPLGRYSREEIRIASNHGRELYIFDAVGRHLRTLDAITGAVRHAFTYDDAGLLVEISDRAGNRTTIERDAAGQPTAIVAPFGQRTTLTVDTNGYLASVTNPDTEQVQIEYADGGLLTRFVDPKGAASVYAYDQNGRLASAQNRTGGIQTFSRTELPNGFEVTRTSPLGLETHYRVEHLPDGTTRLDTTAPGGAVMRTELATNGATTVYRPDGTVIRTLYDDDPRFRMQAPESIVTITSPSGVVHHMEVDRDVELAQAGDPFSIITLTETIDVDGRTYTSVYDGATRTYTLTTPSGRQATTEIDPLGRIVAQRHAALAATTYDYDDIGRLVGISSAAGEDVRSSVFEYDERGFLAAVTDAAGRTALFERDALGRLVTKTLPDGRAIAFEHDANGHRTAVIPPGRPAHRFAYDEAGRLTEYAPPSIGLAEHDTVLTYDADGRLVERTHPDGRTVSYGYDAGGKLTTRSISEGDYSYAYAGDRLSSISAPGGGTVTRSNDGFLRGGTAWSDAVAGTVTVSHDSALRISAIDVAGEAFSYAYDDDGLLVQAGALTVGRDATTGHVTGMTLGSLVDAFDRNAFGEVLGYGADYAGASIFETRYAHDALGRITQKSETIEGSTTTYDYAYDKVGRLREVQANGTVVASYTYDSNGNRLTGPGSESHGYDDQDRLLSRTTAAGTETYEYGAYGELASKTVGTSTTTAYEYDELGNLRSVALPDGRLVEYVIDGQNRRIAKAIDGVRVQAFVYLDRLKPVAELAADGTVVSRFAYAGGDNAPAYMIRNGTTYRIVTDHLGSPRLVVDVATGAVAQRIDYDEFGKVVLDTNPGFQPFGFAGGLYDADTGLVRFGMRDYDAAVGRWTSKDPILFHGGQSNVYAYSMSDPVNRRDANGLGRFSKAWDAIEDMARAVKEFYDRISDPIKKADKAIDQAEAAAEDALEMSEVVDDPTLTHGEKGLEVLQCILDYLPAVPFWGSNPFDTGIVDELLDAIGDLGDEHYGSLSEQSEVPPPPPVGYAGFTEEDLAESGGTPASRLIEDLERMGY